MFRQKLKNKKYYIETLENCELVSISTDNMDLIYKDYAVADRLTTEIFSEKNERGSLQMEILDMESTLGRLCIIRRQMLN